MPFKTPLTTSGTHDAAGDVTGTPTGFAEYADGETIPPEHLGSGPRDGTRFLRDDGIWTAPAAAGGAGEAGYARQIALGLTTL